jgi:SEFIR domain
MTDAPRVFISYSHDSEAHADRVLALADALCDGGIDVILDRYVHPAPAKGWPLWMERNLDAAKFVLMICTETYLRRVMDQEEPGKGTGVRWEGKLIYNRICYDEPAGSRFIPILLHGSRPEHIPGPVRGHNHYAIAAFDLSDPQYEALYRHLTDQPDTPRPDLGSIKKLPPKPRPQPSPSPRPPAATARLDVFDEQHLADVREACKEGLKKLTDKRMNCEDDKRERTILQSLGRELDIDSKKSEHQLIESITNSVIEPGDDETIGKLVNVHEQLCLQNKLDEASVIAEIVDLVLPLCFPRDVISRAWQQLQDHEAVLIEGAVITKTAAEIVMAGVARKSPSFEKPLTFTPSSGPVGKNLIPLEPPAIGDPHRVLEDTLRDLHRGAGLSTDRSESGGDPSDSNKRIERMVEDLRGHFRGMNSRFRRPPYCALKMPADRGDRDHQIQTLATIRKHIPNYLLFIELCPDSKTREFERFVIYCLNTRFAAEQKRKTI